MTVENSEWDGEQWWEVFDSGYILKGMLLDFTDNLDGYMGGGRGEEEGKEWH